MTEPVSIPIKIIFVIIITGIVIFLFIGKLLFGVYIGRWLCKTIVAFSAPSFSTFGLTKPIIEAGANLFCDMMPF